MTRKKKIIIAVCVAVAVVAAIAVAAYFIIRNAFSVKIPYPFAGDGSNYTVTFDSNGGSGVESQKVTDGNPVRTPQSPDREGYTFVGWFVSADEGAKLWEFGKDRIHGDTVLYAHWTKSEDIVFTESLTFTRKGNGYTVTGAGQDAVIVIPATYNGLPVTEIGESAFSYSRHNSDIISVTIPDSVTAIGRNAFYSRSELVTVIINENSALASIGNNAFAGCRALDSIYLPAAVASVGDGAFNNCGGLNAITVAADNAVYSGEGNNLIIKETGVLVRGSNSSIIPSTVKEIAQRAFSRAELTELVIPVGVEIIGNYILSDSAVTTVNYAGTQAQWEAVEKAKMWNSGKKDVSVVCAAE